MDVVVLGIDLGKNVCGVAGLDGDGRVVMRKRVLRDRLAAMLANLPTCVVAAMEACCGVHYVGRAAEGWGHEIRLVAPEYVRP